MLSSQVASMSCAQRIRAARAAALWLPSWCRMIDLLYRRAMGARGSRDEDSVQDGTCTALAASLLRRRRPGDRFSAERLVDRDSELAIHAAELVRLSSCQGPLKSGRLRRSKSGPPRGRLVRFRQPAERSRGERSVGDLRGRQPQAQEAGSLGGLYACRAIGDLNVSLRAPRRWEGIRFRKASRVAPLVGGRRRTGPVSRSALPARR
jgi:hypothetical protein